MSKTGMIIQARMSSTRLPGKIMMPIDGDTTFLDVLISRLKALGERIEIVLATTENPADDLLESVGQQHGIPVFRGSEHNVLDRFVSCAQHFSFDQVVRVCSDNPFLDVAATQKLIDNYTGEDYASYKVNGSPSMLTHYGFFTELVSLDALQRQLKTGSAHCQEHVTNCIYSNTSGVYEVKWYPVDISENAIRCTLDTEGDFENLKLLYADWYKKLKGPFDYSDLVAYIETRPELLASMGREIQHNSK